MRAPRCRREQRLRYPRALGPSLVLPVAPASAEVALVHDRRHTGNVLMQLDPLTESELGCAMEQKWKRVDGENTDRLKVDGGYLYRTVATGREGSIAVAMTFVPTSERKPTK